jgi:hypothetical protein
MLHYVLLPTALLLEFELHGGTTDVVSPGGVIQKIDHSQEYREQCLEGYTATEKYVVRNSHIREPAQLTATVSYQKGRGKTYKIASQSGSPLLQKRVLNRILDEEIAMSRGPERSRALLTSANYFMSLDGITLFRDQLSYVINLQPKLRNPHTLVGRAWIDQTHFSLIKIEGRTSSSPSFWAGKPYIKREYASIHGFALALHSHAVARGLVAGRTEIDVVYSDYVVIASSTAVCAQ